MRFTRTANIRSIPSTLAALTGALAATLSAGLVSADVIKSEYLGFAQFEYELRHMPDFDQRREPAPGALGLPLNGGMYCVPTSAINIMAYMANHGFPTVPPGGPTNWEDPSTYNDATWNILEMGFLMDTDPAYGTGAYKGYAGTLAWLEDQPAWFTVNLVLSTPTWSPNINSIVQAAIAGKLVSFAYGRYELIDIMPGNIISVGERKGGHAITFTGASRLNDDIDITARDPADDSQNLHTQSAFTNRVFTAAADVLLPIAPTGYRLMTCLNFPPPDNATTIALIDGYTTIGLKTGLTFANTAISGHAWKLSPMIIPGHSQSNAPDIPLPQGMVVLDAAFDLDASGAYLLLRDPSLPPEAPATLIHTRPGQPTPRTIAHIPNARHITPGRKRELYISTNNTLLCVNTDATDDNPITATLVVPDGPEFAITYDDQADQVVTFSPSTRTLRRYVQGLPATAPVTTLVIPQSVPLGNAPSLAVNPVDGSPWFLTDATPAMFTITGGGAVPAIQQAALPGLVNATCLSFDDAGHAYVASGSATGDGKVHEYARNPLTGQWEPVADSFFGDAPVGPIFHVSRSRTNYDPAIHSGPGFVNLRLEDLELGEALIDCDADFNGDRKVDVADLLMLINAWGPCELCIADATGDRTVDVQDLLAVVHAWGDCP